MYSWLRLRRIVTSSCWLAADCYLYPSLINLFASPHFFWPRVIALPSTSCEVTDPFWAQTGNYRGGGNCSEFWAATFSAKHWIMRGPFRLCSGVPWTSQTTHSAQNCSPFALDCVKCFPSWGFYWIKIAGKKEKSFWVFLTGVWCESWKGGYSSHECESSLGIQWIQWLHVRVQAAMFVRYVSHGCEGCEGSAVFWEHTSIRRVLVCAWHVFVSRIFDKLSETWGRVTMRNVLKAKKKRKKVWQEWRSSEQEYVHALIFMVQWAPIVTNSYIAYIQVLNWGNVVVWNLVLSNCWSKLLKSLATQV